MPITEEDFEFLLPASRDATRVRIRYYPPDQVRFVLANPEENTVRIMASSGGVFVITCWTGRSP